MEDCRVIGNQPQKFVLAELRFSPVLQIAKYIPDIQDELRRQFPIATKQNDQPVDTNSGSYLDSNLDWWAFISVNRKSAIVVNRERLVYMTAKFPRFDDFLGTCKYAIETIKHIVEPGLILRISLRYGNLINVNDDENISDLVDEHFGMPSCIETLGTTRRHSNETFIRTDEGQLVIRTLYGKHNLTRLPDIQRLPISIAEKAAASERMILDVHHYWEAIDKSVIFETSAILEKLAALRDKTREAFWKITSDYAKNIKWNLNSTHLQNETESVSKLHDRKTIPPPIHKFENLESSSSFFQDSGGENSNRLVTHSDKPELQMNPAPQKKLPTATPEGRTGDDEVIYGRPIPLVTVLNDISVAFGLTKEELRQICRVQSRKTIYNWFNGVARPRKQTTRRLYYLYLTASAWRSSGIDIDHQQLYEPVLDNQSVFDLLCEPVINKQRIIFAGQKFFLISPVKKKLLDPFAK